MTVAACPVFGPTVTGDDVEDWTIALCKRWISTYMSDLERKKGLHQLTYQRPRAYVVAPSFDAWGEDQLPRLIFESPGIAEPPLKGGDGIYIAKWLLGIGVHYSAATEPAARKGARLMTAAVRELLVQRPSLDGHALATDWLDERYDPLPFEDQRSHYSGQVHFAITVDQVSSAYDGPTAPMDPSDDPYRDWPQVSLVDVEVDNYPVSEPLPVS